MRKSANDDTKFLRTSAFHFRSGRNPTERLWASRAERTREALRPLCEASQKGQDYLLLAMQLLPSFGAGPYSVSRSV